MARSIWLGVAVVAALLVIFAVIRYRKKPAVSFIYTVGLLIGLGVALLLVHIPLLPNDDFLRALGHAFIIAAILAITVDHYLKERVLREVSLDVSKYLVGYRLPEEIQNRIRELMQTKFIRRTFEVRCAFEEAQGGKKLKVSISITDEIQNITSETVHYQDMMEFEKHEPFTIHELNCHSDDISCSYHLGIEELKKVTTENETHFQILGRKVQIAPVAESVGRTYRFQSRYVQIHPSPFSENINFAHPTIGVSVEITDYPKGYSFFVTPKADIVSHHRGEFRRLFLPGEHITISWKNESGKGKK